MLAAQPGVVAPVAATLPVAPPQPFAAAQPQAAVGAQFPTAFGGPVPAAGGTDQLVAALQGLVTALSGLVTTLTQMVAAQAAPPAVAGAQAGAAALGGGPAADASTSSGCSHCGGAMGAVAGAGALGAPPAALGGPPADIDRADGKDGSGKTAGKKDAGKASGTGSSAPIQVTAAKGSVKGNAQLVAKLAQEYGVDPALAVAMMLAESGGNERAVGDNGTSFGLFQLHKGGMLTSAKLTPEQAYDPETNARVALKSLRSFQKKTGKSGGALAAASQRPADPSGYARRVDGLMAKARGLIS